MLSPMFIQIHTLTSHSPHNFNRDDLGIPKSAEFLGQLHGRISSQCLKRAIRQWMQSQEMQGRIGCRTRKLPQLIREHLQHHQIPEKLIAPMVTEVASLGLSKRAKEGEELTPLMFLTHGEIEQIKAQALNLCQAYSHKKATDLKKHFKLALDEFYRVSKFRDAVDIALFGRMTTSEVFEECEASVQVAHALTTHPIHLQVDFFTAVDDLGQEDWGAGHMDAKSFSTGIFYKYATLNLPQLCKNLLHDTALTQQASLSFLKAFVMALPSGSQNQMAAHQGPFAVLVTFGAGANTALFNAFAMLPAETPLLPTVTQALLDEFESDQHFFGALRSVQTAIFACSKANLVQTMPPSVEWLPHLDGLWERCKLLLESHLQ